MFTEKPKYYSQIFIIGIAVSFVVGSLSGGMAGWIAAREKVAGSVQGGVDAQDLKTKGENSLPIVQMQEESGTIAAVEKVTPSVVSIIVSKDLSKLYEYRRRGFPFEEFFFDIPGFQFEFPEPEQPQGKQKIGSGSGFIISSDGMILTNRHVVDDEDADYTVITSDGKEHGAKVLARDQVLDLAVVKIEARDLPAVSLGDSDHLKIGQTVIAIGNALGEFSNSVTRGVVSGIGRNIVAGDNTGMSERIESAIQTDAAINPGNSGGPLTDISGNVVGVNTAVAGGQSIGFAIPINEAKRVIESVRKNGRIVRPFLGVRYVLVNSDIAKSNQLPKDYGALVVRGENRTDLAVVPGSPADKAGIEENDIILELNGEKIDESQSLSRLLSRFAPGEEVELRVLHDGNEKTVKVILEEFKE